MPVRPNIESTEAEVRVSGPEKAHAGLGERVRARVRPAILALEAYHVPPAAGFIKLDAMENPYHWPEALVEQWLEELRRVELNRYPDPTAGRLTARLRGVMGLPAAAELLLGNGSDELIQMILLALGRPGAKVLAPEPGFAMYRIIAECVGMQYVGVPLADDFALDTQAMLAAIEEHDPAVVFIAYPNNPTGNLFDRGAIREIIGASTGLVVIDEAYHAFAGESFADAVAEFEHVLVMRTVSKMGLAGLRLGLLAGPEPWLRQIGKTRLPYNINVLTQVSAEFALRHADVLEAQTQRICRDREGLYAALDAMRGVEAFPSRANFILFRAGAGEAGRVFDALKEEGVLIKNLDGAHAALADCLRVTVGTEEENRAFLTALQRALGEGPKP